MIDAEIKPNSTDPVPVVIVESESERIEPWYKKMWRPMLAGTYVIIVIFDFMIMPVVIEKFNEKESNIVAVELALRFKEPTVQIQALKVFAENRTWNPLTLLGGGLFHLAFGALLTGCAVTRGMEKRTHAANGRFLK